MNAKERSTGVSPEPTELDQALADIIEMEEVASTSQEIDEAVIKEKEDTDKQKAESMRKMAMEVRRNPEESSWGRRTGKPYQEKEKEWQWNNLILREKAESEKTLREEELAIRRKQQELEEKKLASYLDQQKSIMELMHHQQQ